MKIELVKLGINSRFILMTIVMVLFCFGLVSALPSEIAVSSSAQSMPAGIVYNIPITLTNSQPIATAVPFQQMITVDSATTPSPVVSPSTEASSNVFCAKRGNKLREGSTFCPKCGVPQQN